MMIKVIAQFASKNCLKMLILFPIEIYPFNMKSPKDRIQFSLIKSRVKGGFNMDDRNTIEVIFG